MGRPRPSGWWSAALLVLTSAAGGGAAEDPAALVRQLGDRAYAAREAAGKALVALGEPALVALRAAAADPDPEVRRRAAAAELAVLRDARFSKATKLELVVVPGGAFDMGSKDDPGRQADEPAHRVRITRPFLLGAYEVTQAEYKAVARAEPSHFAAGGGGKDKVAGLPKGTGRFPVEQVTWAEAAAFCDALSRLDGFQPYYKADPPAAAGGPPVVAVAGGNGYRLPTEAEWEFACRAGTATPYFFGRGFHQRHANLQYRVVGGYGGGGGDFSLGRTSEAGAYKANALGLYDTHGNVGEWCGDWYAADYYPKSPADDPGGPAAGTQRVVRGGSWLVPYSAGRSASRLGMAPGEKAYHTGFRVARTP